MIETGKQNIRAILVGVIYPGQEESEVNEYLDELAFLAETAGAIPIKRFIQKIDSPNPRTFIGSGKIAEMAEYINQNRTD